MDWLDYREKLGIGFDDEEKKEFFYTNLFNLFNTIIAQGNGRMSAGEYYDFCRSTGSQVDTTLLREYGGSERFRDCTRILKEKKHNLTEFLAYYIFFVNAFKDDEYYDFKGDDFKNVLCVSLEDAHIPYELKYENDKCFIFPKGAQELDDALVSEPLEWLKDYPVAHKAFVKAYKAYSDVTEDSASDVADLFRKALESFFQEFFVSDKSLENLKSEYGTFLSDKGVPGEIKNNFEKLLEAYTKYNNNYAKHHDKTSLNVLEYIMYQTGSLIRLLITLKGV